MSKKEALNEAVQELNSNLKDLQMTFESYKALIAGLLKNMHSSLSVILDKTQSVVEMACGNNKYNLDFYDPGKISSELLAEINKLLLLKEELLRLCNFKTGENRPFYPFLG